MSACLTLLVNPHIQTTEYFVLPVFSLLYHRCDLVKKLDFFLWLMAFPD